VNGITLNGLKTDAGVTMVKYDGGVPPK
jgi:hypothetical protein